MSRAVDTELDALHRAVAINYLDEIQAYRDNKRLDKDGNPIPIPAALLNAAAKFLKDNGVDRAHRPGDPEDKLAAVLPEFDDVVMQFPGRRKN